MLCTFTGVHHSCMLLVYLSHWGLSSDEEHSDIFNSYYWKSKQEEHGHWMARCPLLWHDESFGDGFLSSIFSTARTSHMAYMFACARVRSLAHLELSLAHIVAHILEGFVKDLREVQVKRSASQ